MASDTLAEVRRLTRLHFWTEIKPPTPFSNKNLLTIMDSAQIVPPGRLGHPGMCPATDPRANPKLVATLKAMGLDRYVAMDLPELSVDTLTPLMEAFEAQTMVMYENLPNDLPTDKTEPPVEITIETIQGWDGNQIELCIYKPTFVTDPVPCVVYFHGGGLTIIKTSNRIHNRWLKSLALQGLVAISVDFRNAYSTGKHNPYPAALNDCASAVQWIHARKSSLGITKLVLQGESGGANLALTTALKANREKWIEQISGIYATAPYISNGYAWPEDRKRKELPSILENEGYWIPIAAMATMGYYYAPNDTENPHAWPYYSKVQDLKGLPPIRLAMDELDPLRDEGVALYRKLVSAGVEATAHVNLGVVHASSMIFRKALPEVHNAAIRDVAAFAKGV
ncbi:hypothetical protein LTS10_001234 [Elasticomyces elasticus]|nr:hypothetical protein LTS10_001234 [Elasticomyces elasticus]